MPSLYMLDTNTVSYLVSGRSAAARRTYLERESHARIALSAITEAEIRFGLEKKPVGARMSQVVEDFFASVEVLAWDSTAARAFGKLRAEMAATGNTLALMDLLIGAHAVASGSILVTHDRAFQQLSPLLRIEDWATDL